MAPANAPSIGLSYRIKWIFPLGAALTIAGIAVDAILALPTFSSLPSWTFIVFPGTFFFALLVGSAFVMIGAFLDKQRLLARQARLRGILCWVLSAACFSLLRSLESTHAWTFAFMFPAFAGLIAGIILLP